MITSPRLWCKVLCSWGRSSWALGGPLGGPGLSSHSTVLTRHRKARQGHRPCRGVSNGLQRPATPIARAAQSKTRPPRTASAVVHCNSPTPSQRTHPCSRRKGRDGRADALAKWPRNPAPVVSHPADRGYSTPRTLLSSTVARMADGRGSNVSPVQHGSIHPRLARCIDRSISIYRRKLSPAT